MLVLPPANSKAIFYCAPDSSSHSPTLRFSTMFVCLVRKEMLKKVSKNIPKNFNARMRKVYGYLFHSLLHSKFCLWAKRKNSSCTYKAKILLLV